MWFAQPWDEGVARGGGVKRRGAWCWGYARKSARKSRKGPPAQPARGYGGAWQWGVAAGLMSSGLGHEAGLPPLTAQLHPTCRML